MNRFLWAPLLITLAVFAVALNSASQSPQVAAWGSSARAASISRQHSKDRLEAELIPYDLAEQKVLEEWPTLDPRERFSRRMPTQTFYAELAKNEPHDSDDASAHFLCLLVVNGLPMEMERVMESGDLAATPPVFPLHVDRVNGDISVFVDNQWQAYELWRDQNLPRFKKLAGFGT